MLNVLAAKNGSCISRRRLLQLGALGIGGLAPLLQDAAGAASAKPKRARRCIYIFLCGGPSQLDMWDPKPDAPAEIRGALGSILTNVPGVRFGELLPRVARHADKLALIRSMTHGDTDHDHGIVHTLVGRKPLKDDLFESRGDHPPPGAVAAKFTKSSGALPPWVVLPRPFSRPSPLVPYKGQSAGFLGAAYDPVSVNEPRIDSLGFKDLALGDLVLPAGVTPTRLDGRRSLLDATNALSPARDLELRGTRLSDTYAKAFGMLQTDACRRAFDLTREPSALRDRYGRNEYGQSFLLARRLVESGVRFVNVFWTFFDKMGAQFNLWDNHGVEKAFSATGGARTGLEMIRHEYCMPSFDRAFSALLEDMTARGLLDDTLVVVAGEFGRTPQINKNVGRDHWPYCYSQVMAGGGVRGGQVYGSSDRHAAQVREMPVTPDDFSATILHAFGVRHDELVYDSLHRPHPVTSGMPVTRIFG